MARCVAGPQYGVMTGPASLGAPGARARLREATAEVHEALHHLPAFEALLAGALPLGDYRAMMAKLHAYHGAALPICRAADAAIGLEPAGWSSRERLARLAADLAALGDATPPDCPRLPHADRAWNIGYAYVVRGSAIGGQVLHRALASLLPDGAPGRGFFALGAAERADWRRFCALLDAGLTPEELAPAAHGAHAAFAAFRTTMADPV